MFTPPPPRPESENETNQIDNQSARSRQPTLSELVFGLAALCQIANGVFTFLPWCRDGGDMIPGYLEYPRFAQIYDGWPGRVNLATTVLLLTMLFVMAQERSVRTIPFCNLLLLAWGVGFFLWLLMVYNRLGILSGYGMTLSLAATFLVALFSFGAFIARSRERGTDSGTA
jgi:hypothetical protein